VALGAIEGLPFKYGLGGPMAASYPMGAVLPVVVDQPMASGAHLFNIPMHDARSVIGRVLISVLDKMAIVATIVSAVIQFDDPVGKLGSNHIRIGDAYPVGVTKITIAHHHLVFKVIPACGLKGIPDGFKRFGGYRVTGVKPTEKDKKIAKMTQTGTVMISPQFMGPCESLEVEFMNGLPNCSAKRMRRFRKI